MAPGIPQVHFMNHVQINGHSTLEGSSGFLLEYNGQMLACAHAMVLSSQMGVNPGVEDKKLYPSVVKEWRIYPKKKKGGLFGSKWVVENPILVTGFLNLESPTNILLMSVGNVPAAGNYTGVRLGASEIEVGMPVVLTTCPSDLKDLTQVFCFAEVVRDNVQGYFVIALNEEIRPNGTQGSAVTDASGRLLGMVYAIKPVDGKVYYYVERTTQLKQDLIAHFGEPEEQEVAEQAEVSGPFVTVRIKVSGDGFASPKELDLRAQVENEVEKRNLGRVVEAGSGMGVMEITFAEANDVEGIRKVLEEFKLGDKAEIELLD